jgi:hypothetical protein
MLDSDWQVVSNTSRTRRGTESTEETKFTTETPRPQSSEIGSSRPMAPFLSFSGTSRYYCRSKCCFLAQILMSKFCNLFNGKAKRPAFRRSQETAKRDASPTISAFCVRRYAHTVLCGCGSAAQCTLSLCGENFSSVLSATSP